MGGRVPLPLDPQPISRSADRSCSVFEQHEAVDVLAKLKRVTQVLDGALSNLRRVIELQTTS
ncbi:hypothetical protein [Sphingomonas sp. PP-CC-3G-468]|uniref:hypothetical protein n=1 Tax=Sphingomonas sp. PP-CC-3G-468 TaxID=2135656 RepID=UPI001FB3C9E2|nr:hypothetical protein [Sphingomonas sp. PP-CC-3G-468]